MGRRHFFKGTTIKTTNESRQARHSVSSNHSLNWHTIRASITLGDHPARLIQMVPSSLISRNPQFRAHQVHTRQPQTPTWIVADQLWAVERAEWAEQRSKGGAVKETISDTIDGEPKRIGLSGKWRRP